MPENTPIYGFTYPCPGDPVDPAAFATLATQIDARLLSIQADADYATGRYVEFADAGSQGAIVVGVETALTNPGGSYTVLADGVYAVTARFRVASTTSVNAARLRVRRAGTPLFGRTINTDVAATITPECIVTGAMTAVVGNVIDCTVLFNGVGTGTADLAFGIRQVVRIL